MQKKVQKKRCVRVEEDGWIFGRFRRVCPAKSNGRRTSPKLVRASTSVARCIPACGTTPRGVAQRASRCVCKPFAPFSRAKSRAIYTRIIHEFMCGFTCGFSYSRLSMYFSKTVFSKHLKIHNPSLLLLSSGWRIETVFVRRIHLEGIHL